MENEQDQATVIDFRAMTDDHRVKMFSTCYDKHIAFTSDAVIIQCNDGTSIILGAQGVEIVTDNGMIVHASNKISLNSEKTVSIEADKQVKISSGDSFVELNPFEIKVKAQDIRMNPEGSEEESGEEGEG